MYRVVPKLEDLGNTVTRRLAGGMERLRLVGPFARVGALGPLKMPVTRRASNDRGSNGGLKPKEDVECSCLHDSHLVGMIVT